MSKAMLVLYFILLLLIVIQSGFAEDNFTEDSMASPLESGFEKALGFQSMGASFLFLAVLFVFFDLEVIFFILSISSISSIVAQSCIVWVTLVVFISLTLLLEWRSFGLKWSF